MAGLLAWRRSLTMMIVTGSREVSLPTLWKQMGDRCQKARSFMDM